MVASAWAKPSSPRTAAAGSGTPLGPSRIARFCHPPQSCGLCSHTTCSSLITPYLFERLMKAQNADGEQEERKNR